MSKFKKEEPDMDLLPEVIITSSSVCSAFDAKNGNLLINYPSIGEISPKTLCLMGEDYLIGAVARQPLLKVWTVSKLRKQEIGKFVCPGIVSALAVSSCGYYCVAGIKENIYVWQVTTGELLNVISRHYQDVSCLKFTGEDSRVLSGGKDGHVMVWVLSEMIAISKKKEINPQFVWNNHSVEVTDIYIGSFSSRVATVSLDMTCKVYDLDSGILLSAICMDTHLTAVIMDPLEFYIFLGDDKGYLYQIVIYEKFPREIHSNEVQTRLRIHQQKIISFSFSIEGTKLMTASEDHSCKLWDIQSMTCVLNILVEGTFTNAFMSMKPAGISELIMPQFYIRPFRKEFSDKSEKKVIESNIHSKTLTLMQEGEPAEFISETLLKTSVTNADAVNASKFEGTFQEALQAESVAELRTVNNQLYAHFLKHGFKNLKEKPESS